MPTRHANGGLSQLWQVPLLIGSVGLFGYAAYLFIDPKPGPSVDEKIGVARSLIRNERPDAAIDQLNHVLTEKLDRDREAAVHLLLGQSLADLQQQRHSTLKSYATQVIEQTNQGLQMGAKTSFEVERRLGDGYEQLGRPTDALLHYRQAMAMDPGHELRLLRKVIDLQLSLNQTGPAEGSLDQYLKSTDLSDAERGWALCAQAKLLIDRGDFVAARPLLDRAVKLETDPASRGQADYFRGYCAYKVGDSSEAEKLLRSARQQMKSEQPLDADAGFLLGQIYQDKADFKTAESFYQDVVVSHPDHPLAGRCLLGRGECRIRLEHDDAGVTDLNDLTRQVADSRGRPADRPETISGLASSAQVLSGRGNFAAALELLDDERMLQPVPSPDFFNRLAVAYEQESERLRKLPAGTDAAEKIRRGKQIRDLLTKAGDACMAFSKGLILIDDRGYGEAMWRAIDLYDRAAEFQATASALDLFVAERPRDPLAPSALLRLGRAYQAMGQFDKAVAAFELNQSKYPNSLPASKSAVPLAQALIAKGPQFYAVAERVLIGVVENNALLTPEAEEFKQAIVELAQLYYRTGRFDLSIARLEEFTARYPSDERTGQLLFLTADSYRKSARPGEKTTVAAADAKPAAAEAETARRDKLNKSKRMFDRVVEQYREVPPATELDKLYNKLAQFYRADCLFELGQYEEAIRLYDAAAFRYQDDPSSLAAYVQIVNAYYALGKPDEAKAANERAKWLLKRIPPEAFNDGAFSMPKEYWENQLKWSSRAGLW